MLGLSDRRNNILQSNGFYEQFPEGSQLFNLPQRAYEYKYEGGSDLCRPREREEDEKEEGQKDDSILRVSFYVAVSVIPQILAPPRGHSRFLPVESSPIFTTNAFRLRSISPLHP